MNVRTENWNGHEIRFVEVDGEWWAVAVDICKALGLRQVTRALKGLKGGVTTSKVGVTTGKKRDGSPSFQEVVVNIINEKSIYKLVFKSKKSEAENFQDWVFEMLKQLRQSTGLEGFQVFRMLDKEHQKEMMAKLHQGLKEPKKNHFIKANTIANKAVSTRHGYKRMIKKSEMTPEMLVDREHILNDTVELMSMVDRFNLPIKVSQTIYGKYIQ